VESGERNSNLDENDRCWLVKSGERVYGPFTKDEIKQKLFDKEVVVIDEVITPNKRWRYIRDEPAFALIVEEVRKASLGSREDTEVGTSSASQTHTETFTGDISPDARTPRPSSYHDAQAVDPSMVVDAVYSEEKRAPGQRASRPSDVRSYGYGKDSRVQRDLNRTKRLVWLLTFVILLGIASFFMRFQAQDSSHESGESIFRLVKEASAAKKVGDYARALDLAERVEAAGYIDPDLMIDMAAIRLRLENFTMPPARILDVVQAEHLGSARPEVRAKLETVRGLLELNQGFREKEAGGFSRAIDSFNSALRIKPDFAPATINRHVARLLDPASGMGPAQFRDIFFELSNLSKDLSLEASLRSSAKMYAVLALLQGGLAAGGAPSEVLSQAAREADLFRKGMVQYWQEMSLLRVHALVMAQNFGTVASEARALLSADPFLTDEHMVDLLVFAPPLTWGGMLPRCQSIHEAMQVSNSPGQKVLAEVEALLQFCRFKAGAEEADARAKFRELEEQNISDSLLRSLSAYSVMALNPEEAKAKLADVKETADWDLGRVLKGRLCPRTDLKCLFDGFQGTTNVVPPSVYFRIGAARYYIQRAVEARSKNDRERAEAHMRVAREYIEWVRKISPNYVPLLKLVADGEAL